MIRSASVFRRGCAGALLAGISTVLNAEVVSETLIFLQQDGVRHLTQRALRSESPEHHFHVDKRLGQDDLSYVDPNRYEWDERSSDSSNVLIFKQGDFNVMYPGRFDAPELAVGADGIHTFNSWDGSKRPDGHFGMWHEPGNFTRFSYAWIFPANLELVDYASNREGEWVKRTNTLTFFAADVNDLTFTIRYRQKDSDGDGVVDVADRCAGTAAGAGVGEDGCVPVPPVEPVVCPEPAPPLDCGALDSDGDGVADAVDRCAETPLGIGVDAIGCPVDTDADGVPDYLDACADTRAKVFVDRAGCEPDLDADGVPYSIDQCRNTPAGGSVNELGCAPDADGDGVADDRDACPHTPAGNSIDARGCVADSDHDGIADDADQCPDTERLAPIDASGCARDGDGDGVPDHRDRCPSTAAGVRTSPDGCEPDADADGVSDRMDHCGRTPAGVAVDAEGCEPDTDGDGVVDALDACAQTQAGAQVDAAGCVPDGDGDGVIDGMDLCPATAAGIEVDRTGCDAQLAIRLEGVQFETDSANLTDDSLAILDGVAATLRRHGALALEVAGHTDAVGKDTYNKELSQRRAETVRGYLLDQGVSSRLEARGYGEEVPVADNDTEAGRALNRRVELKRLD